LGVRDVNYVKCNLCGRDNTEVFFNGYNVRIVKCKVCGLIYNNPQLPVKKETYCTDYYKEYYAIYEPQTDKPADYIQGYDSKRDLEIIIEIKKRKKTGKILEVGCCFGFFLKLAQQYGYETKGVEISDYAASYARDVLGLDIFIGQLKKATFPDNYFDIIYMSQTLEHLPDPFSVLQETRRILRKDGILLVEAPNEYHSLNGFIRNIISKERRPSALPPLHLYYFTPKTLKSMFKKAGFKIINKYITYSLIVDITKNVESLLGKGIAGFLKRHSAIRRLLASFIRKSIMLFDLGVVMRVYAAKD
jgi:SAM-dependent methyltransferase